ncbi:MAG: cytochrome c-type biogenesis protein [Pseudomonadota bacterium]|nr:cytochrome c-type biogenesis protein [Pseudomonadota bacterium]
MKIKIFLVIFLLNLISYAFSNEIIDENKIHKNLRCLVCQGQSISDSNSDFAVTLKLVVKDLISQGKSEEEIYIFLSEKYGDWILFKPKLNVVNFLLWFLPYFVLFSGGFIILYLVRKNTKKT